MKKNFAKWVCRFWYKYACTPGTPFLVFFGLQKTCKGAKVKGLQLQYVQFANVQKLVIFVFSGPDQKDRMKIFCSIIIHLLCAAKCFTDKTSLIYKPLYNIKYFIL